MSDIISMEEGLRNELPFKLKFESVMENKKKKLFAEGNDGDIKKLVGNSVQLIGGL